MSIHDHNQDVHLHTGTLTDYRPMYEYNNSSPRFQATILLKCPNLPHPQLPGPLTEALHLATSLPPLSLEIAFTSSSSRVIGLRDQVLEGILPTYLGIRLCPFTTFTSLHAALADVSL